MADETTDSSNHEQGTFTLTYLTNELEGHEEFVGLYHTDSINAVTITWAIKDVLIKLNLPFDKLRAQCNDGASAMSSSKRGVDKKISDLEPGAVYTRQWSCSQPSHR